MGDKEKSESETFKAKALSTVFGVVAGVASPVISITAGLISYGQLSDLGIIHEVFTISAGISVALVSNLFVSPAIHDKVKYTLNTSFNNECFFNAMLGVVLVAGLGSMIVDFYDDFSNNSTNPCKPEASEYGDQIYYLGVPADCKKFVFD